MKSFNLFRQDWSTKRCLAVPLPVLIAWVLAALVCGAQWLWWYFQVVPTSFVGDPWGAVIPGALADVNHVGFFFTILGAIGTVFSSLRGVCPLLCMTGTIVGTIFALSSLFLMLV